MLVKEKPSLLDYNGTGNYVRTLKGDSYLPQVAKLEEVAFPNVIEEFAETGSKVIKVVYPGNGSEKISDLPLTSEFGDIGYEGLVLARLDIALRNPRIAA